jgi:hypothetical protein
MVYACPTWDYVADAHVLELQRLQDRVHHDTGNFDGHTQVREMHVALEIPYFYY